ncbi:major facilitator superfamily transporter [Neoasaia chiangmaiensis NBRC 101099]|uniref:MFS transporter n=1 Tax=Neoasaia chiangmaiensis TaxID=320497 RepID=UPI00098B5C44|nr:MFS transporter [Neoasaia chiangmaiensis]GBR42964.1 major facilitator superfamily transporter [Neoasaia chiangmaiensis NBRC 101099]GEN16130.1 MFS transporter [Neoasaia chiangmaiensis]
MSFQQIGHRFKPRFDGFSRSTPLETDIPARLDRLPWSRFHVLVVVALGITWILDGLEVTVIGSLGPSLQRADTLALTPEGVGMASSAYVVGAVIGALLFGWMTDRLGRRQIFFLTLAFYIVGVGASACAWSLDSFALFRLITGLGIGGEYAAINSAIDELVPARLRGRVDLMVNGTFWAGAALGAVGSVVLLNNSVVPVSMAWRFSFGLGAILGVAVLFLRSYVPESPRWLMTHRRVEEAQRIVAEVEARCEKPEDGRQAPLPTVLIYPAGSFGLIEILRFMVVTYRMRTLYVLVLMVAQAFLYNAVFFTYGMVLTNYLAVPSGSVGWYILPLALGNLCGPLLLARWFDTIGRRRMIGGSYAVSGVLMFVVALAMNAHLMTALTQTLAWSAIFFFASAAASSAYLTASELFPLEMRALAIALFYAMGTLFGGAAAPAIFGHLIGTGSMSMLVVGYIFAAVLMLVAAGVAFIWGVDAENKSLEEIAPPLSSLRPQDVAAIRV